MTEMKCVHIAVEDVVHEFVLRKLIEKHRNAIQIIHVWGKSGYGYLKKRVRNFNRASKISPWIMLTDLDRIDCPPLLVHDWLPDPINKDFLFRVAVREAESWILADYEGFASFLGVSRAIIPQKPDGLTNPKKELLEIVKKCRKRSIKEDMLPLPNSTIQIGPDYNKRIIEFIQASWNPELAAQRSPSLAKTIHRISDLAGDE